MAELTIQGNLHIALFTGRHLMSEGYDIGITSEILIGKESLLEEVRRIRVYEITSVIAYQNKVRVRIGVVIASDSLSKLTEGEVGRDNAHNIVAILIKRLTI